ncbi:MAG: hypothetical protein IPM94_14380 [bacterium]|nr:hypothetical protein [bacterium]
MTAAAPLTQRRALWLSTLFASGILVTIALIGAITAAAACWDIAGACWSPRPHGRLLANLTGRAGIFLVVGLILLGW